MLKQRLPDAAYEKFEELSSKQLEGLHKLVKDLQVLPLKFLESMSFEQGLAVLPAVCPCL